MSLDKRVAIRGRRWGGGRGNIYKFLFGECTVCCLIIRQQDLDIDIKSMSTRFSKMKKKKLSFIMKIVFNLVYLYFLLR